MDDKLNGHPDLTDSQNPEWTEADFARARPGAEVLPPEAIKAFARARGRPRIESPKVAVSLRLDPDVLAYFKAKGPGWRRLVNEALRKSINAA
jgi:uncharacterized protein (DUF4415 family)